MVQLQVLTVAYTPLLELATACHFNLIPYGSPLTHFTQATPASLLLFTLAQHMPASGALDIQPSP